MTTFFAILTLGGVIVVEAILWGVFLDKGLRRGKLFPIAKKRVVFVTLMAFALRLAVPAVSLMIVRDFQMEKLTFLAMASCGLVYCQTVMISVFFKLSFGQAFKAWIHAFGAYVLVNFVHGFFIQPYYFDNEAVVDNTMAPTLLGHHWKGTCPECGNPAFATPLGRREPLDGTVMVCQDNFHVSTVKKRPAQITFGDHFIIAKHLQPERWDLILFQFPESPQHKLVMRVVGLPGEVITIDEGQVFADGKALKPPKSIRKLYYLGDDAGWEEPMWGGSETPAKLAEGEYFVLGDNTEKSKDSRFWQKGAPGANPYAVPSAYIEGVVTHIYWPFHRICAFR